MRSSRDAVVIGSGPNGLAAAVTLARAGLDVLVLEAEETTGGGARTLAWDGSGGLRHDLCSAVHPLAAASPFFTAFDLRAHGVELIVPEVSSAHVLDPGHAALVYRDLEKTADGLGADGAEWRRLFAPLIAALPDILQVGLAGRLPSPRIHGALGTGMRLLREGLGHGEASWHGAAAPALLASLAGHTAAATPSVLGSAVAALLGTLAQTGGWPVPRGGSGRITAALEADLRAHGGQVRTGTAVTTMRDLPPARAYLFDTSPDALGEIMFGRPGGLAPGGGAAAKVDFELSGPVPWSVPELAAAGTVHLGGSAADVAVREAAVRRGEAGIGLILASAPAAFDPSRRAGGTEPLWTYAHVAHGSSEDVADLVTAQIEAAAPGFRDLVVRRRSIPAAQMQRHDRNYTGGDITAGVTSIVDIMVGTRHRLRPYATVRPDVFLCSASTPPGPGVHGMCGYRAAQAVLRRRFGIRRTPFSGRQAPALRTRP